VLKLRLGDLHRCRLCRLKYGENEPNDAWSESVEEMDQNSHMHNHHTAAIVNRPCSDSNLVYSPERFFPLLTASSSSSSSVKGMKLTNKSLPSAKTSTKEVSPSSPPSSPPPQLQDYVEAWVVDTEMVVEMVDGDKSRLIKNSRRGVMVGVLNVDKVAHNGSFIFRRKVVSYRPLKLTFSARQESRMIISMQGCEDGSQDRHLDEEVLQRVNEVSLPLFCGAVHITGGGDAEKLRPTLQSFMTGEDSDMTELGACRTEWVKTTCGGHVVHLPRTRCVFTVNMLDTVQSPNGLVSGTHVTLAALDLLRSWLIMPKKLDHVIVHTYTRTFFFFFF
jgi:hypothetical protein